LITIYKIEQSKNNSAETVKMRVFISYSHRDAAALERLHVHLAVLRREGHVEAWFDRNILAGDAVDDEIARELQSADIFLLLLTPDFLASNYCVEREMQRALERQRAGEARIVSIIVEPCDWASVEQLRRLKAVPVDGKPISDWANANTAYLNVIQELRRIIDIHVPAVERTETVEKAIAASDPTASRYRVRRDFDEIDRSEYRDAAFLTIKDYFHRAITEINQIEGLRGRFVDGGPKSFGSTIVNKGRTNGTAHITVHCRNGRFALGDIFYSYSENAQENTANGGFNVSSDEYEQFLVATMSMFAGRNDRLTSDQAAEYLWNELIEQAGVTHA
jgi:hypothetical protein